MNEVISLSRIKRASGITGLPRSSIYAAVSKGTFPAPVHPSPGTSAWPDHELDAMNRATLAGMSEDEKRDLVKRLHAARIAGAVQ